ncbi:MAG: hypothetical protein U1E45_00130 [Geminicoccaceae bacterium]
MTATRRTLGLLARLKRQEVADLRRSSIAAEEDLVTLSRELVAHTESFSRELAPCESTAWLLGLHGGYVARSIDGTRRATTAKRSAEEEAAAAGDRLQEGAVQLRTLERAEAALAERERDEAMRRQGRAFEDLALTRLAVIGLRSSA